jgi:hypothetical protein
VDKAIVTVTGAHEAAAASTPDPEPEPEPEPDPDPDPDPAAPVTTAADPTPAADEASIMVTYLVEVRVPVRVVVNSTSTAAPDTPAAESPPAGSVA